jgi:hypothetical protein
MLQRRMSVTKLRRPNLRMHRRAILFATVLLPVTCFNFPITGFSRPLLPEKHERQHSGLVSLRAQLDKTTAVGWIGRPLSAVSNVQETDKRAEIRMSVSGTLKLEGENIKCDVPTSIPFYSIKLMKLPECSTRGCVHLIFGFMISHANYLIQSQI